MECEQKINPSDDSVKPGTSLSKVMRSIKVKMRCGCSIQLSDSKNHICGTPILKLPSPSKPISNNVMEFVGQPSCQYQAEGIISTK